MNARELLSGGSIQLPLQASGLGGGLALLLSGGEPMAGPTAGENPADPPRKERTADWPPEGAAVHPAGASGLLVVRTGARTDRMALGVFPSPVSDPEREGRPVSHLLLLETRGTGPRSGDPSRSLLRVLSDPEVEERLISARSPDEVLAISDLAQAEVERPLRVGDAVVPMEYRVYPDTPAAEVLDLMARKGLSAVPVVGEGMQVVGIFTAGDAVRVHLERRGDAHKLPTREVMTRAVLCVTEDQALEDAARIMVNRNLRQVPVVREGELIGFLTRESVLRALHGR